MASNLSTLLESAEALSRRLSLADADVARPAHENEADRRRGLVIGTLGLLVAVDVKGEVLDDAELHPLPRTRSWCRGLVNVRGRLLPAFDLHEYLSVSAAERRWWLVLRTDVHELAVAVDALPPSVNVASGSRVDPDPALPEKLREHVDAAYRIDDRLWLEFRHGDLFSRLAADVAL